MNTLETIAKLPALQMNLTCILHSGGLHGLNTDDAADLREGGSHSIPDEVISAARGLHWQEDNAHDGQVRAPGACGWKSIWAKQLPYNQSNAGQITDSLYL